MRKVIFSCFRMLVRGLKRAGFDVLGSKNRTLSFLYNWIYDHTRPHGMTSTRTAYGMVWVDADHRGAAPKLLLYGCYEPDVAEVVKNYTKPGTTVIDIGANVGYMARAAALSMQGSGLVVAFEPDSQNVPLLRRNLAIASKTGIRTFLANSAVGDRDDEAILYHDWRSNTRSSLELISGRPPGSTETVTVVALDSWIKEKPEVSRLDLLKIDVEGGEFNVLVGAKDSLLRWHPVIVLELWPQGLEAHGASVPDIAKLLDELGYEVAILDEQFPWGLQVHRNLSFGPATDLVKPTNSSFRNVVARPRIQPEANESIPATNNITWSI